MPSTAPSDPRTMSPSTSPPDLVQAVCSLGRHTTWTLESTTALAFDAGHPQGLTTIGDDWLITTVFPFTRSGTVVCVDRSGSVVRSLDVTDGDRFHPGGVDCSAPDNGAWIAVAEYRPNSTTVVVHVDANLRVTKRFAVDDHLGAVCDLGDGTLFAVSWGSRSLYRLSHDGVVLERRANPSHVVDYQDLRVIAPGIVLASGVADMTVSGTPIQLGGLALLDTVTMSIVHEVPIGASMPSGRSITYNGVHVTMRDTSVRLHCLVDDTTAAIGHWVAS